MKPERAQELYSDYMEGTLTPALRQALEQHLDADPAARADFDGFARIYALLEQPLGSEAEVPLGFRARIMERATTQREAAPGLSRSLFGGWFSPPAHRRATGGAVAALAAVAVIGALVTHQSSSGMEGSNVLPTLPAAIADNALVQSVDTQAGPNGSTYHEFHLHLPADVPSATVSAYVVTATEQITDPAHLADATPAAVGQHLTNRQGLQIPIAPVETPPAGSTLNLLAQWTPDGGAQPNGAEAVFTPYGAADPATAAPTNAGFLDAAQAVASHYGVTVIVDVASAPTQAVTADLSGADPAAPLKSMASAAGYTVQKVSDGTYYLSRTP